MPDFNKVMLIGRLTRDPQLRYTPANMAVCDFGLATGRKYKTQGGEQREETTFIDITAFGKQAELVNQHLRKGSPLFIEGRLKLDQWDDKQTGQKRSKLSVVVENFQFLGGRDDSTGDARGDALVSAVKDKFPGANVSKPTREPPPYGDEQRFKEDDIPF